MLPFTVNGMWVSTGEGKQSKLNSGADTEATPERTRSDASPLSAIKRTSAESDPLKSSQRQVSLLLADQICRHT